MGFRSVARTTAPSRRSNATAATPDLRSPTTKARLPLSVIGVAQASWPASFVQGGSPALQPHSSSQLQRGQREQRQHQSRNPKPGDNLRLRPTQSLKMMMQRSHFEDSLPMPQLIAPHLQDHAHRFQNED